MSADYMALFRRVFAVGVLLVIVIAIFYIVICPFVQSVDNINYEGVQTKKMLRAYEEILQNKGEWEKFSQRLNDSKASELLLNGAEPTLASAKLQTIVKQMVEENGGVIKNCQIIAMVDNNGLKRAAVRINFSIPVEKLLNVLYLDEKAPVLFINSLTIHAPEQDRKGGKRPVILQISADYYAFIAS